MWCDELGDALEPEIRRPGGATARAIDKSGGQEEKIESDGRREFERPFRRRRPRAIARVSLASWNSLGLSDQRRWVTRGAFHRKRCTAQGRRHTVRTDNKPMIHHFFPNCRLLLERFRPGGGGGEGGYPRSLDCWKGGGLGWSKIGFHATVA